MTSLRTATLSTATPRHVCISACEAFAGFAGYYSPKDWDGPTHARAGLMPRWSRDGRFVAFDSAHIWGTGSQMYVAGVQQMKVGWPAAVPTAKDPPARSVTSATLILAFIPLLEGNWGSANRRHAADAGRLADGRCARQRRTRQPGQPS